mgnify:CR=1 FL=1
MSEQREKPIISIVIPVYNVDMFLRKALQSVADQTFQNYEAIIVDDGSTDRCPEIIAKYVRKYSNFKSVRQKNAGLSAARNTGLRLAQGEFIAFMDSDDYYQPPFWRICITRAWQTTAIFPIAASIFIFPITASAFPCLLPAEPPFMKPPGFEPADPGQIHASFRLE